MEVDVWLDKIRGLLKERTGRDDIEVTGGPYRGYDVKIDKAEDGHPIVDLYSPIRYDGREQEAIDYAVELIKDWDATTASQDDEATYVKPVFERIQEMFPEYDMNYVVMDREKHYVQAQQHEKELIVHFDLWPAITEQGIAKIASYIRECVGRIPKQGGISGLEYDK